MESTYDNRNQDNKKLSAKKSSKKIKDIDVKRFSEKSSRVVEQNYFISRVTEAKKNEPSNNDLEEVYT